MVKTHLVNNMKPPKNIEYYKKGKKFCRVSIKKGNQKQP